MQDAHSRPLDVVFHLERFHCPPREMPTVIIAAKMPVSRGGPVDWPLQAQAGNHSGGCQIEMLLDQSQSFLGSKLPSAKGFHS